MTHTIRREERGKGEAEYLYVECRDATAQAILMETLEVALPGVFAGIEPEEGYTSLLDGSRGPTVKVELDGFEVHGCRDRDTSYGPTAKLSRIRVQVVGLRDVYAYEQNVYVHRHRDGEALWAPTHAKVNLTELRRVLVEAVVKHSEVRERKLDHEAQKEALMRKVQGARDLLGLIDAHIRLNETFRRDAQKIGDAELTGRYDMHLNGLTADEVLAVAAAVSRARKASQSP